MSARTVTVQIRMTVSEREVLSLAAAAVGLPLGTWIRSEAIKRAPGTDLRGKRPAAAPRRAPT